MASLYLLGHDNHYTSHTFKSFFWKPYVSEAMQVWETSQDEDVEADRLDRVIVEKVNDTLVGISPVLDYIYRPSIYKETCLYDWICLYTKKKMGKAALFMLKMTSPPMHSPDKESLVLDSDVSDTDVDTDVEDDFSSGDTLCDDKDVDD